MCSGRNTPRSIKSPRGAAERRWVSITSLSISCLACSALLIAAVLPTRGEIYSWTDASGQVHFTEDLNRVPAPHRSTARVATSAPSRLQTYSSRASRGSGPRPARSAFGQLMRIPFVPRGTLMMVEVELNDRITLPFLVDTGASGIAIPESAALELGLPIGPGVPRTVVQTANGTIAVPVVKLDSVQVGPARVEHVEAFASSSMGMGLLGGTFFNNFVYQVDSAAGVIILRPNDRVRGGYSEAQWRERFHLLRGPLAELEAYLARGKLLRASRVGELEAHRARLETELEELEREANLAQVPHAWRR